MLARMALQVSDLTGGGAHYPMTGMLSPNSAGIPLRYQPVTHQASAQDSCTQGCPQNFYCFDFHWKFPSFTFANTNDTAKKLKQE